MKKIKIGLIGLGTVGKGVYDILTKQKSTIDFKTNDLIELAMVSSRTKKDFIDETKCQFVSNPLDIVNNKEIDVIIEVIGGVEMAKTLIETAIKNQKKVVTANKSLIALHGLELAKMAKEYNSNIYFEASVGGAIPIIKLFRESFFLDKITSFAAILNGTCNYILTKMQQENLDFVSALKQAQDLGYAESNPSSDIEGIDTADKLAILSSIASLGIVKLEDIYVEGISEIKIEDIRIASELDCKIKLLALYKQQNEAHEIAVYPALVKKAEKIANVDDSFNAALTKGENLDESFIMGRGAGGKETASAIISDLNDIVNNSSYPLFGVDINKLKPIKVLNINERVGKYFIKLICDKNEVKNILSTEFLQKTHCHQSYFEEKAENKILAAFITDSIKEELLINELEKIKKDFQAEASFIRVEQFNK